MSERRHHPDAAAPTTILAPLDDSAEARAALPYAMALATPGTTIVLLTAVPAESDVDAAKSALEQAAQPLRVAGHAVQTEVAVGDPDDRILNAAAQPGVGMIVMASRGRGALGRLIYGSVADKVAREALVPTVVVRAGETGPGPVGITRLVVPLDGSPLAEESLPVAAAISRRLGTSIYVVRAVDPTTLMPPAVGMGEAIPFELYEETEKELDKEARDYLDAVATRLREQGLPVATDVLSGTPAAAIMEASHLGDVVVLSSHERTGVMRWLLGSVAETLTREDQSPVILVPAAAPAPAAE